MKKLIVFASALLAFSSFSIAEELTAKEKTTIEKAVKLNLKYPESAKFKWMALADTKHNPPGRKNIEDFVGTYCGLVQAKIGYEKYSKFEPFKATIGRTKHSELEVLLITTSDTETSVDMIDRLCGDDGYTDFTKAKP